MGSEKQKEIRAWGANGKVYFLLPGKEDPMVTMWEVVDAKQITGGEDGI